MLSPTIEVLLAKLYGAVISARLTWYLETNNLRAWSQAGGRPELGVLQHHFALQHFKDLGFRHGLGMRR